MKPPRMDQLKVPKSYEERMRDKPISQVKADQAFWSSIRAKPRVQPMRSNSQNSSIAVDYSAITTRKMTVRTKKNADLKAPAVGPINLDLIENTFANDTIM